MERFEMVAKTFQGLEEILAKELRALGAENVQPGCRMVSFDGTLETLYRANMCCRTALRILRPFYKFFASSTDELYEMAKEFDWASLFGPDKTFAVDTVAYSEEFTHSRYATYRVKDAIVDWFRDHYGDKRPRVSTHDADILINLHIDGDRVTLSLDSSGESLHKRGYRAAQTEAPINEVLVAGIILRSGWRGECPLIDPMCGSGTFLIEAALIAANINPGVFRSKFAFESWKDFDADLFDSIYNDDSQEREVTCRIIGADISPAAIAIAQRNIRSAGVQKYIDIQAKSLAQWDDAPEGGMIITNPPYGERINVADMEGLYALLGSKLKHVFQGYHAWVIGYRDEYFAKIGLAPSEKIPLLNGALQCTLMEYVIFEGKRSEFRKAGGEFKHRDRFEHRNTDRKPARRRLSDDEWKAGAAKKGFGGRDGRQTPGDRFRKAFDKASDRPSRRSADKDNRPERRPRRDNENGSSFNTRGREDRQRNPRGRRFADSPYPFQKKEKTGLQIEGKTPSLPPSDGPIMRERRAGWKTRPDFTAKQENDTDNKD